MKKALLIYLVVCSVFAPLYTCAQAWQWGRGNTGASVDAWAVATDPAGNVYGAGAYTSGAVSFGSFAVPPGAKTVWAKYNSAGTVLWASGTISGSTGLYNITTDALGNLILFGYFSSSTMQIGAFTLTGSSGKYFVAKIDPSGTVLWAINAGNSIGTYISLTGGAYVMSTGGVTTDGAGNIYITSSFTGSMTIGSYLLASAGNNDIFIVKYSPSGSLIWATSVGGTKNDYGLGITVAATGNVYIAGAFYSPSIAIGPSIITDPYATITTPQPYAYIAKFSAATGMPLWGQAAGGVHGAFGVGLSSDAYGNVYMTGGFADTTITFGSTTVTQTYAPPAAGKLALFLVQYSSSDIVTWNKTIGSATRGLWGFCIALASCGQVWVSGNYNQNASIDGSTLTLVPGPDPVFIAGYDLLGSVVGYAGLGSGGDDQNGIAADGSGNIYLCSDYQSSLVVGPDILPGLGGEHFYLAKYANTALVSPDTNYAHVDSITCAADSIILTPPAGYSVYYWDDSSVRPTRTVGASGIYWVYSSACGAPVLIDTFYITIAPSDSLFTRKDTSVCIGLDSATLTAQTGYSSYTWSTGSTGISVVADTEGAYIAYCRRGCNLLIDTFNFKYTANDTTFRHKDTTSCVALDTVTLSVPSGFSGYHWTWSTGNTTVSITVNSAGDYVLYGSLACDVLVDTFRYTLTPNDSSFIHKDTSSCEALRIITLSAPPGSTSYNWSNGNTSSAIIVNTAGDYIVTGSSGCKFVVDTIHYTIRPNDSTFYSRDTNACTIFGDMVLHGPPGYSYYAWSNSTVAPFITIFDPGNYICYSWLGCKFRMDTFKVTLRPSPYVFLGNDTELDAGNTLLLNSQQPPGTTYLWSNGSFATSLVVSTTGTYWLTVTNQWGCRTTDTIVVFDTTSTELYIPNAFSPDGANNVFKIIPKGAVSLRYFRIFNRWGNMVFETIDINSGWNGRYNGIPQPFDVYVYQVEAVLKGGKITKRAGNVTLIR